MAQHSYEALYSKYRPQTLEDLVGQSSVKQTLVNAITRGRLQHAYLFTGPRGAGKTSTARILAKCLNCSQAVSLPTIEPCGICDSCRDIAASRSLDVIEIDAASHSGVDDTRSLMEGVHMGTMAGNYKVYIIDEVHMLSTAAFNALLKVFEEPPPKVVFILATTESQKVLATIKSRCQTLEFRPITVPDSVARLRYVAESESIAIEAEALEFIARRSDGAMRDALGLLDQAAAFAQEGETISLASLMDHLGGIAREDIARLFDAVAKRDPQRMLANLEALFDKAKEPLVILKELIAYCLGSLEQAQHDLENFELVQIIEILALSEEKLRRTSQAKNFLRATLLKLVYRQDILIVKEFSERLTALEQNYNNIIMGSKASPQVRPKLAPVKPELAEPTKSDMTLAEQSPSREAIRTEKPNRELAKPSEVSFLDSLSPACKGLLASSNARLASIEQDKAIFHIPEKFRFLKTRIEAKTTELCEAVSKHHSAVQNIVIEVVSDLSLSEPAEASPVVVLSEPAEASPVAALSEAVEASSAVALSPRLQEAVTMSRNIFNAKFLS